MNAPANQAGTGLPASCVPWLLAAALALLAPHTASQPLWLSSVATLLLLWRTLAWWYSMARYRGQRLLLPPRWLLWLLATAVVLGIVLEYHSILGRTTGVALLMLLLPAKLLETRSPRDAGTVVLLGFFLLFTQFFESQSMLAAGWLLLSLLLILGALLQLFHPTANTLANVRQTLRQAALLLLQALPFMLALYLFFPRVSGPLWGLPQDALAASTGLSEEMAPGSLGQLIRSDAIALRADFQGPPPPSSQRYWRGPVLDEFDGHTWRQTPSRNARTPHIETFGAPLRYTLTLEPHQQRWLLALEMPAFERSLERGLNGKLQLLNRQPIRERLQVQLSAWPQHRLNADSESPFILNQALLLPPGNDRSRALANSWFKQTAGHPLALANLALQFYRQQAFFYTLSAPPPSSEDEIDSFLFDTRRGFCEHYASSFVFLMRAGGVPARVVTGYQGGEVNPVDQVLTVRQSDAHAWAEIWVVGQGWLRYDPTAAVAPSRVEQGLAAALPTADALPLLSRPQYDWLRQLRYRWEAVNYGWNRWILGYTPQQQRELLSRLGFGSDWRSYVAWLASFCGFFILALLAWYLRPPPRPDPMQREWQALLALLARAGYARPQWQGPQAFCQSVITRQPALATWLAPACQHYIAYRYGPHAPPPESWRELRRLRYQLQRHLRHHRRHRS